MNWVIRMCWLLWHRIIRQDSGTPLSACHTGLPGTMAFMASYLLGVPNDPVQQVFFSMLTPYQNNMRQTNKPVLGLNSYILYSDWLLIGSNPEVFPEFYLHKVVLVSLLHQNSFWFFLWHCRKTGKWISGCGHYYLQGEAKELLLPSVFSIPFTIRKKMYYHLSMTLMLANSCVQENPIMLYLVM